MVSYDNSLHCLIEKNSEKPRLLLPQEVVAEPCGGESLLVAEGSILELHPSVVFAVVDATALVAMVFFGPATSQSYGDHLGIL